MLHCISVLKTVLYAFRPCNQLILKSLASRSCDETLPTCVGDPLELYQSFTKGKREIAKPQTWIATPWANAMAIRMPESTTGTTAG